MEHFEVKANFFVDFSGNAPSCVAVTNACFWEERLYSAW